MGFLNPGFLLALPVVLIPLILSIINRFRKRGRPFPPLFLLSSSKKGRGYSFRDILRLLLRMAALASLVLVFAHPFSGDPGKRRVFVFDNSIFSHIRGADGVNVFEKGLKLLHDHFRMGDSIIYLNDKGYEMTASLPDDILPVDRKWDINLPHGEADDFLYILISPMCNEFPTADEGWDLFPEEMTNVSLRVEKYSVISGRVSISIRSMGYSGPYYIMEERSKTSRILLQGEIKKGATLEKEIRPDLRGNFTLRAVIEEKEDDYPKDNEVIVALPPQWSFYPQGEFPYIEKVLKASSTEFVPAQTPSEALLSLSSKQDSGNNIVLKKGSASGSESAVYTLESDLPVFSVKGSPLKNFSGETLVSGGSGAPYLMMNSESIFWGFDPSSDISGLSPDDKAFMVASVMDRFLISFLTSGGYGAKNPLLIERSKRELKLPSSRDAKKDLLPLFILLIPVFLIIERLL